MAEREEQLDREVDTDDGFGVDVTDDAIEESTAREAGGGLRERAGQRVGLSKRGLVVSAVVALLGVLVLGSLIPFGLVGTLLGLFVAAFLYGTVAGDSQYLSMGLAGGTAGGVMAVVGNLTVTLLGPGVPIAAVGAVGGFLAGVVGHYFGRDLRDGLTREI